MRLIKPSCEVIPQENTLEGVYKMIELAGRTCYKSEDKITETSAKEFVDRMIKSGHGAMLEHGTIYLHYTNCREPLKEMKNCPYTRINKVKQVSRFDGQVWEWQYYVTTNLRALLNNAWEDALQYLCEPTEYHEKRIAVLFNCDRGVSHEFVRHRTMSFAQQSQRYCNYSKDKFDNSVTYIMPHWLSIKEGIYDSNTTKYPLWEELTNGENEDAKDYIAYLINNSDNYIGFVESGMKPQDARGMLCNATATKLVMTGFISDWKHFFELRTANSAHPDARALAIPLQEDFKQLKFI